METFSTHAPRKACVANRQQQTFLPVPRDPSRLFWEKSATRLASRINFAAWLEAFAPLAFGLCTAAAIAIYALRRSGGPEHVAWLALLGATSGAAGAAWWRSRSRWYAAADARVLLESSLGLDAGLSAATAGITAWPAPRTGLPPVVRWRSLAAPGWLSGALLMLAAGLWAPVTGVAAVRPRPVEPPPALAETAALLQEIAKLNVADPAALNQMETQVRELSDRPAEEQYTHSALEAADTLRDQALAAVQDLARHYETAAAALETGASDPQSAAAQGQLQTALEGLRSGRLPGESGLTASLDRALQSKFQLSPDQLKQLQQRMAQNGAKSRGIGGAKGRNANVAQPGEQKMGEGEGPGAGGVSRGPGEAPLAFYDKLAPELQGKQEASKNDDLSRASLGDYGGSEHGGEHRVDRDKLVGPGSAGAIAAPAKGGDAAWVDRLSPADRAVVREIFK